MPKTKTEAPPIDDRQKGQHSLELPLYLDRFIPAWRNPEWLFAENWRAIVAQQPFAVICRDTLINGVAALDWQIVARDSSKRESLKSDIDYYTKFFQSTGDYDYQDIIQWVAKDCLDIPFGGAVEVGRLGDDPNGRVAWILPLDGGTLFPFPNNDWPVAQMLREAPTQQVYFRPHQIDRMYIWPRTEIRYRGWGMPPPVKIYLALEALSRGDKYYANLLLDTPQVGILDLMDMEKETAENWVESWRTTLTGIDPFKIPVLYQHSLKADFISFTRNPSELMFDKALLRYEAILAGGYGIGLSDVGIQPVASGGETLAGSIRQDRRSRKNGLAMMKNKVKSFFDRLLPEQLEFVLIDQDDEVSVATGRARLASATAFKQLLDAGVFDPNEVRQQLIADGLISISIPDEIKTPPPAPAPKNPLLAPKSPGDKRLQDQMGKPVPPSQGGQGEVKMSQAFAGIVHNTFGVSNLQIQRMATAAIGVLAEEFENPGTYIDNSIAKEKIKSSMLTTPPFSFGPALDDVKGVCRTILQSRQEAQVAEDFVLGKRDDLIVEESDFESEISKISAKVMSDLNFLFDEAPEIISDAVIMGIYNYFQENGVVRELDSGAIIVDNRVVDSIKNELDYVELTYVENLVSNTIGLSNIILEDIENGKSEP